MLRPFWTACTARLMGVYICTRLRSNPPGRAADAQQGHPSGLECIGASR
eukprot:gene12491-biopygen19957